MVQPGSVSNRGSDGHRADVTQTPQRLFFAQERKPGELLQLDWTYARELNVTIQGELLDQLLCHCVLPYSNWEWATRCVSESFLSLVSGLQAALARLGKSPLNLGTDNTRAGKWRATEVRDQVKPPERKVIELAGLTPA